MADGRVAAAKLGCSGGILTAVFQLQDGTANLGTVTNTFTLGALGGSPVAANYSSGGVAVTMMSGPAAITFW